MTTRSTSASDGQHLQVGRFDGETGSQRARPHDQGADAGKRCRDRVGQAEGEKVRFGVGPQHAKGSTTSRVRARATARLSSPSPRNSPQRVGHLVRRGEPIGRPLRERPTNDAIDRANRRRAGQCRRLLVHRARAARRRSSRRRTQDGRPAFRTGWRRRRRDPARVDRFTRRPVRAPCSAVCRPDAGYASARCESRVGPSNPGRARPKSSSLTP